ncbi:hypothetical protein HGA64_00725 [Candidatus Falkowbacteria bacterium]|nr:hypothetical protein [Candidatus Falkowbacteria bacterium]
MKNKIGIIIVSILSVIPAVIWAFMKPLADRFVDFSATMTSLGQVGALVGMSMFGLNLILAARPKWLENFFKGMNVAYIKHHQIGAISFVLLLSHPIFLAIKYGQTSWELAAQFLFANASLPLIYGRASLVLMLVLLGMTFYVKLPYQIWKLSHKFLGLAYFLATLHLVFIYSDTSQSMPLRMYMLALSVAALIAAFYRSAFYPWLVPVKKYKIVAINQISPSVNEVVLRPDSQPIAYMPGQFVFISFDQPGFKEIHPFTISSAEGDLTITVKKLGDYTAGIGALRVGTLAKIEGPFGVFSYLNSQNKKQVWVAGGIGVTPFLSMARSLPDKSEHDIDLFYCTKNESEAVFIDELKSIADSRPWFRLHPFYSADSGKISVQKIGEIIGGIESRDYFLCGPVAMMSTIKKQLIDSNIPKNAVHSEEFAML